MANSNPKSWLAEQREFFREMDPADRIAYVVSFTDHVKELPPAESDLRDRGLHIVTECASPAYVRVDVSGGRPMLWVDAPREAAVVRGFLGVCSELFGDVIQHDAPLPNDLLAELSLTECLSARRRFGLGAIYRKIARALQHA